jgi:hypothetical protein
MGDVVNLNRYRKAHARTERERQAEENRIRFGRPKAETQARRLEEERSRHDLDGKKRDD